MLSAYALGLGVPFLLAALFIDRAARFTSRLRRFGAALQIVGGLVMVTAGVAMMTGRMSQFALWILDTFPVLGKIG
jgi:cytochrome c-type biogenesis protein